ncbi:hypothetical protein [Polyangium spumosum]|uniref:Uncharacterized protein n=1 Tax=Polyangium spumosum TaxID=889282 RepID=A0A6N7PXE0_9BACT|nr:hypothetical protein [Polyangium spumosum]MRG96187.1 hypothetical protein [Polyangium spumosum]
MALSPLLQALCDVVRPELGAVPAVIRLEEADPGSACPPAIHHRLHQAPPRILYRGLIFRGKGVAEPRGGQMRAVCPYRQHPVWRDLGMATLPAIPERDISYFCAGITPA